MTDPARDFPAAGRAGPVQWSREARRAGRRSARQSGARVGLSDYIVDEGDFRLA
jgi:hypothetical protein